LQGRAKKPNPLEKKTPWGETPNAAREATGGGEKEEVSEDPIRGWALEIRVYELRVKLRSVLKRPGY